MASKIQIINAALAKLGQTQLTSLSENNESARTANALYDFVVEKVISRGPWSRARSRARLAQLASTPAFGYSYAYALPTTPSVVHVIRLVEGEDYTIEGNKLLCDYTSANIVFTGIITDATAYGSYLTEAITASLAAEMAASIGAEKSVVNGLTEIAEDIISVNLTSDIQQQPVEKESLVGVLETRL